MKNGNDYGKRIQHISQFKLSYTVINDSKIPGVCNSKKGLFLASSVHPLWVSYSFAPPLHVTTQADGVASVWDISGLMQEEKRPYWKHVMVLCKAFPWKWHMSLLLTFLFKAYSKPATDRMGCIILPWDRAASI